MARQRTAASSTNRASRTLRSDMRTALMGAGPEQLRRLSKVLGNDALADKLSFNDKVRDALLEFIHERLQAIELAQRAEKRAMRERGDWFRRLMRGEAGLSLPEPARWAGPALAYKKAAEALCAGELGRGAELLRTAAEADRATFKAAPQQLDLRPKDRAPATEPSAIGEVQSGEGCAPTAAPELINRAARIASDTERADLAPRLGNGKRHTWWEVEENEEEEKKQRENPRSSRRLREPAAQADLARRPDAIAAPLQTVSQVQTVVAPEVSPAAPEKAPLTPKPARKKR